MQASFVKIDVKEYEMHVLRGADQLIAKHRPIFLVGVGRLPNTVQDVFIPGT